MDLNRIDATKQKWPHVVVGFSQSFRLAPMFYLATLVQAGSYKLFVHFSKGALWYYPEIGCPLTWWLIISPLGICVGPSWHVGAEMQLFVFSPVFILALYYRGISGLIVLAFGAAGCISFIAYIRNGYYSCHVCSASTWTS